MGTNRASMAGLALGLALVCGDALSRAQGQDACESFAWDVHQERAVFASTAQTLPAGKSVAAAPTLEPNHLYELALVPQDQVSFAATPGKRMLADGAFAGIAQLHIAQAGTYRVSLNGTFWIDLASGDHLIASSEFTGQPHCEAPRKIVQFTLPAGDVTLQLSGATTAQVRVAVTAAAATTIVPAPTH